MNLKQLIVVRPPEGLFEIWTRKEYDDYMTHTISAGAVPAYSIVTHFNEDERLLAGEELKEGGGMKTKEEILERLQKENPHSIPVFKAMDEYAAQFAGTREIEELKKVLRTAKTALQNCMEVQAGNGKTLQDNAILLINNILEI